MNNNLKSILNEWNSFLITESNSERVLRMIDELKTNHKGTKIYITHRRPDSVAITYGPSYNDTDARKDNGIYGSIICSSSSLMFKNDPNKKGIGQGETNSCWYVNLTSKTTKGMGPLLYEVLIEFISHYKKAALKPDAHSVSAAAQKVWRTFDNRADITKIQLDIDKKSAERFSASYELDINQITPDNISDDTTQGTAVFAKNEDWSDSFLSRAYKKNSIDLITILKEKELIVIDDETINKTFKLRLGKRFSR